MWSASLVAIVLVFLARLSVANNNEFKYPPPDGSNAQFVIGDVQTIRWNTTYSHYNISLWQNIGGHVDDGVAIQQVYNNTSGGGTGMQTFDWTVQTYGASTSTSKVFFFRLVPGRGWKWNFESRYFVVNSAASATGSPRPSRSTSTSDDPTGGAASSASTDSTSDSSSTAMKVGLGVGLGVGIPLVLIAGVLVGMKVARQRRSSHGSVGSSLPLAQLADQKDGYGLAPPEGELARQSNEILEASADRPPVELPGDGHTR
ncbi:hypothetical protein IWX49DRAFT_223716 [Phyllosticta citricarpa]|uniref:Mid2 domain-containing protein n=2 Tax=Phyllosticta TaxID=121621 RepID=A0ABR1MMS3_9PEZI